MTRLLSTKTAAIPQNIWQRWPYGPYYYFINHWHQTLTKKKTHTQSKDLAKS